MMIVQPLALRVMLMDRVRPSAPVDVELELELPDPFPLELLDAELPPEPLTLLVEVELWADPAPLAASSGTQLRITRPSRK